MDRYKEHGITVEMIEKSRIGDKFKGMREQKPFIQNNELRINLEDGLYRVSKYIIINLDGKEVALEESNIDTDIAVRCIYLTDTEVVVIKRSKNDHNFHIFPGGHIMNNEDPKDTVIRELDEEVGINTTNEKISFLHEFDREEYGKTIFFMVKNGQKQELLDINPDETGEDENKPIWVQIDRLHELENLYPEGIVDIIIKAMQ